VITSLYLAVPISVIKPDHMALAAPGTKRFLMFWLCFWSLTLVRLLLMLLLLLMSDPQHGCISPVI
jgi:hypothetical protein